jgi:hypothetical protein
MAFLAIRFLKCLLQLDRWIIGVGKHAPIFWMDQLDLHQGLSLGAEANGVDLSVGDWRVFVLL